jgi:hypothetical protein
MAEMRRLADELGSLSCRDPTRGFLKMLDNPHPMEAIIE